MRRFSTICLLVSTACGCSHIHHLDSMGEEEAKYFKERAKQKSFTVQTLDGNVFDGTDLVVETDTIAWSDSESGERIEVSSHQVQQIVFVSKAARFADGFLIGLMIGGSVGGILGYAGGDDCEDDTEFFCISRGGEAFLAALVIGIPAGIVGGLAGLGKGSKHIYYPTSVESTNGTFQPIRMEATKPSNQALLRRGVGVSDEPGE
jgi:hypothetical protein